MPRKICALLLALLCALPGMAEEGFWPFADLRAEEIASVRLQWEPDTAPLELEKREHIEALVEVLRGVEVRASEDAHLGKRRLFVELYRENDWARFSIGDCGPGFPDAYGISLSGSEYLLGERDYAQLAKLETDRRKELNPNGAWADVREETVTPDGATFLLQCAEPLTYGELFSLERRERGAWTEVPIAIEGNYAFAAIAYILRPGQSLEKPYDWNWLYGSLEPGEYRIVIGLKEEGFFGEFTIE